MFNREVKTVKKNLIGIKYNNEYNLQIMFRFRKDLWPLLSEVERFHRLRVHQFESAAVA